MSESGTAKKLVLKKNFNWMCDSCGIEKITTKELTTSEKVCECGEGFFYTKSSIQHEKRIVNAKTRTVDAVEQSGQSGASAEKDEFNNQFNNLVNSLGAR